MTNATNGTETTGTAASGGTVTPGQVQGVSFLRAGDSPDGGPTLVLLHGIGSDAQSFAPAMSVLAGRAATLAWDAPGYGGSDPLEGDWPDASAYARRLDGVLAALGLDRIVLVGHSLGCLVAARYATLYAEKVAGLVLCSPAAGYRSGPDQPMPPSVQARLDDLKRLGPVAFAAARAKRLVSDPVALTEVASAVERAMARVRMPGYEHATQMLAGGDLEGDVAKATCPTLVLCGSRDVVTPPDQAKAIADVISADRVIDGHALRLVEGAGHALPQERPAEFADLVEDFVGCVASVVQEPMSP